MNGYLKPTSSILQNPLQFKGGSIMLQPNYQPKIDFDLLAQFITSKNQFH